MIERRPILAAPGTKTPRSRQTLPPELLERAVSRVRVLALVVLLLSLVRLVLVAALGSDGGFGRPESIPIQIGIFATTAFISLALAGLSFTHVKPARALGWAGIYCVLVVTLASAADATAPLAVDPFARGIPLAVPFILIFPVIVPLPPGRFVFGATLALIGATLATFVTPSLVALASPDVPTVALAVMPIAVGSIVGALVARIIYGLGKDLGAALTMGSYELVSQLGKGGMGEVWKARHGMLARDAAVKLIRKDLSQSGPDEDAVHRFEHEAKVVASLRSQHTIQLWDYGVTADGALYFAMELLDGLDLDKLVVRHGPQPPERVVHILRQACHSLAEAHAAGLVHRDIKPANIFIARLGRDVDVVKVLDFGLAMSGALKVPSDSRLTRAGSVVGTPAYMAPEQAMGERVVDGRVDIYALGLVAWWLLTGRDAFRASSDMQVMFAHVNVEPEPPSAHAPMPIPPELDGLVLACLAKRPDDRPPSADALAERLAAIPLPDAWTPQRAQAWWSEARATPSAPGARTPTPSAVAETRVGAGAARP